MLTIGPVPGTAGAAAKHGCKLVREGFTELTCSYHASGPGRYTAFLEASRAVVRVNGIFEMALGSRNDLQSGALSTRRGDLVHVTLSRQCGLYCVKPPSAAYLHVRDR